MDKLSWRLGKRGKRTCIRETEIYIMRQDD
jgi:hypothetical protein